MKITIKTIFLCGMVLATASCRSGMDDKAIIDADIENGVAPAPTITIEAKAVTPVQIDAFVTLEDTIDILETGVMYSLSESFADASTITGEFDETGSYSVSITNLEGGETYYVRSYVVSLSGVTNVSETNIIETPKPIVYPIDGTYTVTEFEYDSDAQSWSKSEETYEVEIAFVDGSSTQVSVLGIWGTDIPVIGEYDSAQQTVTISSNQQISEHPYYGPVYICGMNEACTAKTNTVTLKFTPEGGKISSSNFAVFVQAGTFGYYKMQMVHNPDAE